ncbi:ATP-binding protein [Microbispora sp. RL4-1S]|uniref:ATP-binding protein n=1 Tax=Microbispora oryzae TaxID=2806554 RepID=A0A941AHZ7_9ACTN|nr:ATP-binding protein [Microbispora oryzae]MBP2702643.1 ATP-binding protein [Microbispora oryzae]
MTAELAGPGAATAPPWLTSVFDGDNAAEPGLPGSAACALHSRSTSAAAARDFTARILYGWGFAHLVPDAQLVVSELVTNALRHAQRDGFGPSIRLRLVRNRSHIGCGVSDGSERVPALSPWSDLSETGRGLHLVDALSVAWGWIVTADGKVVWALFDSCS